MKLRFTARATQDLADIADYIRSQNPVASVKVRAAILETLQMFVRIPHAGRAQTIEGVRKFVARRYPYIIYYSVDAVAGEVNVIAINHPAREREYSDL